MMSSELPVVLPGGEVRAHGVLALLPQYLLNERRIGHMDCQDGTEARLPQGPVPLQPFHLEQRRERVDLVKKKKKTCRLCAMVGIISGCTILQFDRPKSFSNPLIIRSFSLKILISKRHNSVSQPFISTWFDLCTFICLMERVVPLHTSVKPPAHIHGDRNIMSPANKQYLHICRFSFFSVEWKQQSRCVFEVF